MSLEVKYIDIPEGIQEAAQAASDDSQSFSTSRMLMAGVEDRAWASLEPASWLLDGSRQILKDVPENAGWWSSVRSGEDGRFAKPPIIYVSFPEPYTATGITFTFSPAMEQWCSQLRVIWYKEGKSLGEVTNRPTRPNWVLVKTVESFDAMEIQLLETNLPGQFAKLQHLQIGQVVIFGINELVKVQLLNEVDPSLCQISVDTMSVAVRDRNGQNLMPQKNQKMEIYKDGVQVATQYIKSYDREEKRYYTFSCQSVIGLLEEDHLGGIYSKAPLTAVLQDVLGQYPFALDESFAEAELTGYLPVQSRRQALQQIAFAIGAAVTSQKDGVIRLMPLQQTLAHTITKSQIFSGSQMEKKALTGKVEVYSHRYVPGTEVELLLDREEVDGEDILFVFSQPHYDYTVTGGSIESSGANWVKITASGIVTLTGKKYNHTKAVYSKRNPIATAAEIGNVVCVEDATLIHAGNVKQALARLFAAQNWNNTLKQEMVVSGHRTGQMVSSVDPWGTTVEGYITRMDSLFTSSGHTAEVTIVGIETGMEAEA